ncbi:MAG: flagellar basal body rod protein FlgC [Planctomycetota bacterium]|jgi:flagellar basal-body rod protein FlgC|nr:flagellar basal body rod protein FlgC [Planctomycetota bacterium]MDP6369123.1 flagellar basal body rod protein FlgC [Planctomycetota bacterium]MDP6518727.1 flagellar basal body rod protein FlgC [Planctomycetota bacterium]MDP6837767.1 flagellar basal body rod protein FlgC [Planctomycetota bacterium]MDP6954595.1 flagellar basal body rod protein FlgC [Planctomycetota bacterium]
MGNISQLFSAMRSSSSGLSAERTRIDVISRNIANAQTTSMPDGTGPYRRQVVHFAPILERTALGQLTASGVRVERVANDLATPFEIVHDPSHPDSDRDGNVHMPNVNTMKEMADLITAMRSYESNLKAQEGFFEMARQALRLAQ